MSRVYIHEIVEVDGTKRAEYQHHMTANWVPEASSLRRQGCFGVFSVVGSTGPWPCVINIWEYEAWADLAHNFSVELDGPRHRDPMLERWWREAAAFRRGGLDRVLVAHSESPGVAEWEARGGTGAVGYLHEMWTVRAGASWDLSDRLATEGVAARGAAGLDLVGLWRTAMRSDDEVVALWSIPDWDTWAAFELARSSREAHTDAGSRNSLGRGLQASSHCWLLVDAELSPLRTGRQPRVSDRRPILDLDP